MARMSVADGVEVIACTPHILPGVYATTRGPTSEVACQQLQLELDAASIAAVWFPRIRCAYQPGPCKSAEVRERTHHSTIAVMLLVEPPHHILPPNIDRLYFSTCSRPVMCRSPLTRSAMSGGGGSRMKNCSNRLVLSGVWMQMTAGAIIGGFGENVKRQALKMLHKGMIHIVASDALNTAKRPPVNGAKRFHALR